MAKSWMRHDPEFEGPAIAMHFGLFHRGSFVAEDHNSSDLNKMFVFNGQGQYGSDMVSGQRFLVIAYLHKDAADWPAAHKEYLTSLGFRLPAAGEVGPRPDPAAKESRGRKSAEVLSCLASEPLDRVLVEGCCEPGSLLQRRTRFSRGCKVSRSPKTTTSHLSRASANALNPYAGRLIPFGSRLRVREGPPGNLST